MREGWVSVSKPPPTTLLSLQSANTDDDDETQSTLSSHAFIATTPSNSKYHNKTLENLEPDWMKKTFAIPPTAMRVFILFIAISLSGAYAFVTSLTCAERQYLHLCARSDESSTVNRRSLLKTAGVFTVVLSSTLSNARDAFAQPDCMTDCLKNCKLIAPKVSSGI